ncbi:MAG: GAF domain-containing protein [Bacteroidales bacterium]|jgi:methyl-accepting chemotaxis protein|nr:GAF domain-containing protein [Bacteroidales bacterium]
MKIKLKIQQKIQLFIISASFIIYIIAVGYISLNARKMAYNDATEVANRYVHETANDIKAKLDADLTLVKTLSNAFHTYKYLPKEQWQDLFSKMYYEVFKSNPQIYSLWDSWELNAIDPEWDKPTGRYVIIYWREGDIIKHNTEFRSLDGDPVLYAEIKTRTLPAIWEPYEDVFVEDKAEKFLMTSLNAPILENGKYVGIVAIDITLDRFQKLVEKIKPFEGSYAYLISNGGTIAGHPEKELLNSKIEELFPEDNIEHSIAQNILKGNSFSYVSTDANKVQNYISYAPIFVGETNTPWSLAISVPIDTIMAKANRSFRISLLVGLFGIILITLVIAIISRSITNPITRITELLKQLAKGHLNDGMKIKIETGDEIEEMTEALNDSINGLNKKVDFANRIGQGELDYSFDLLSEEDALGNSLIEMRSSLIKADKDEEKRKIEDEKRRWANEGLAMFADILRLNNDKLETLANEIIINLVNYLKANQGGLFILNDDDKENIYFDLLSAFAYDRIKFMKKNILIGEGLIGTCAIEKKTIFMTDVPQNYMEITSGLGGASPKSLLIVPLKLENDILGVLEIASFNVFEKNEIEFVEKLAESIASTLSSVKINIRTKELLERSQQQAEEMTAQEEEMRQNMEELQATQEESSRKGAEMEGFVDALNVSSYVVEYDIDGVIQKINDNYLALLGLSNDDVIGTHHSGNIVFTEQQKIKYDKFWGKLRNGEIVKETTTINIKGNEFVFSETYSPIRNAEGEIYKILKISNNITNYKKLN